MSGRPLVDQAWLPEPEDFRAALRALEPGGADVARGLRALASTRLDLNQLHRLARLARGLRQRGHSLEPLAPIRLGLVSHTTAGLLAPAIEAAALRHGVAAEVVEAPYGQAMQSLLDPASALLASQPDAVLIALDPRALGLEAALGDAGAEERAIAEALATSEALREAVHARCGCPAVVQTLVPPSELYFGSLEPRVAGAPGRVVRRLNERVREALSGSSDLLLEAEWLAERVGLSRWHDPREWLRSKHAFSLRWIPHYAEWLARILAVLRGKDRRCLVLDLDDTLWGGVVGDVGLAGITLGQGTPEGEAFCEVQRVAARLRERGVVLAVCSKNDDEVARAVFREHPEMLLREADVAVFQANWQDKPSNLRTIADALGLGLESLVFLDDNPAERGHVRYELPEVAVPELPSDPALVPETLLAAGYFEATTYSAEDRARADDYAQNARRHEVRAAAPDLDGYLASLQMKVEYRPFDALGRARIVQLVNKSNQFNLTTRRYDALAIERMEDDPAFGTLQVRLQDRFSDAGMISVVVWRAQADAWEIDTWIMSCRVLGRRLEEAVLAELVRQARAAGVERLVGVYRPTARNHLVRDHYARLGFEPSGEEGSESRFSLRLEKAPEPRPLPFEIHRAAAEPGPADT